MNMMKARFALLILAGMTTMAGCASTESLYAQSVSYTHLTLPTKVTV